MPDLRDRRHDLPLFSDRPVGGSRRGGWAGHCGLLRLPGLWQRTAPFPGAGSAGRLRRLCVAAAHGLPRPRVVPQPDQLYPAADDGSGSGGPPAHVLLGRCRSHVDGLLLPAGCQRGRGLAVGLAEVPHLRRHLLRHLPPVVLDLLHEWRRHAHRPDRIARLLAGPAGCPAWEPAVVLLPRHQHSHLRVPPCDWRAVRAGLRA